MFFSACFITSSSNENPDEALSPAASRYSSFITTLKGAPWFPASGAFTKKLFHQLLNPPFFLRVVSFSERAFRFFFASSSSSISFDLWKKRRCLRSLYSVFLIFRTLQPQFIVHLFLADFQSEAACLGEKVHLGGGVNHFWAPRNRIRHRMY